MVSSSSSSSLTIASSPSFFSNDRSLPSLNPIAPSLALPAIRSSALAVTSRSKGRRCLIRRMSVSKGDGSETAPTDMIFGPILEDGVFRFDCSVEHRKAAFPSVSFKNSKDREVPIPSHIVPAFTPTYSLLEEQQVVTFQFSPGTSFYGTGEVGGQLERTGKRVFTWNTDAWGYGPGTTSLYQSHPWVLVILPTGETLGVLADTTRKCEIDLRKEGVIRIISPPSYPIITFGPFSTPTAVLQSLSHAVGTVFMPPKWALGYHQCRWSYMSGKRVAEIAQTFRDKKIPSDVIWMDIDYMDGFRCFTFDKERFPDPSALAKHLHNNGFKAIWMLDPGIKQEEGFDVYDSGSKNNVWVKGADGEPFIGEVWPGPCVFPDYTNSKARSWWANLVKDFISNGVDGIWNDMNEPAVFKVVTKTMPENNIHRGDDELGGVQYHSHYHNVYGMLMARSTYEGMELADKNKRPFVLTRAGFIGSQRYAATWTGDNLSTWEPGRPPCLELRPHPQRETQTGKFLRSIACTETQLWAGQENGMRFWNLDDVSEPASVIEGQVRRGDEDTSPFHESVITSPTLCLLADQSNKLMWSGHKDGKIRAWKMDQPPCGSDDDSNPFKERISWLAHRGPVNSIVISSYGDMWSCSEGGVIKIWPWESLEKSLLLKPEEKHMAALLIERSPIDLRSQVTVNGTCSISSSEVKYLLNDSVRAKVWAVQSLSFSIWDARSKDLLKVLDVEGQAECRADMPPLHGQQGDHETRVKFPTPSKKEKSPGFLQRSRNAIMGAAGAVRRVATRSAGGFVVEDTRKTEAIILAVDGTIWTGNMSGLIVQWDGDGTRLRYVNHHHRAVMCFCTFGDRIYVGYASGYIQVLDLDGDLVSSWVSHNEPVIKLAAGGGFVFSLATHGGVRGWYVASPGPLDNIIRTELSQKETLYARQDSVRVLIGTWNVGQGRASHGALMSWLGSVTSDVGIVVVGLQEVDMGAGFLAMSAAKETVGLEGSVAGQWWIDAIGKALDEKKTFERMGSRQLAGLLISLWARKEIRTHVGDLDVAAVPCGFGRAIGNKGGVGLRIRVYDRTMCFVNCHLAAHLEAVNRRNADFNHIFRLMVFSRGQNLSNAAAAGASTAAYTLKTTTNPSPGAEEVKSDLAAADMIAFCGDFNYRLYGITYDEARDFITQRSFDWLREMDQLRQEMKLGKVFQGMREALITFPPTYKFERNRSGLGGYDSGEKKRIPAWCDRVIYRDTQSTPFSESNLQCPVVSSVIMYEACMDVTESDHKPVRCKIHATIAHVDKSVRRHELGKIIKSNEEIISIFEDLKHVPETTVSTNSIVLQSQDTETLTITNSSTTSKAIFTILCGGQTIVKDDGEEEEAEYNPRGSFGLPRWLEVSPASGIIKPEEAVEVKVHHEDSHTVGEYVDGIPQSEDTRDKEAILMVNIRGSCSTTWTSHSIKVRHCFSAGVCLLESKPTNLTENLEGSPREDGEEH